MSEPTNEPVLLTGNQLKELIRPVILAYTKHEEYTDEILRLLDDGARMHLAYNSLSPAAMLAYAAASLLDPVDPLIVEVFAGVLLDKLRITEPPADLPSRDNWIQVRNETISSQADAIAEGFLAAVEVHSFNSSDLEVDWSQLADLDGLGESNG